MKKSTPFLWILFICYAFAGCVHTDPFLQVRPGMSKGEITQLLGNPDDRSFHNDEEKWTYHDYDRVKVVTFKKDKVTTLKNDELAEQRLHEIERAKAGATKININGIGRPMRCPHSSAFGRYPEGGGCNAFGCWPPGGECTAFGCSYSSHCGATSCPDAFQTLPCE